MPKWCVVPYCKSGSRTQVKRSVFRVPKDAAMLKKWEELIPGIVKLDVTDVVCERHFNDQDISREWVKLDANGKVIAQVPYKRPQLRKLAVPSTFSNALTEKENCVPLHEYAKTLSVSKTNPVSIANQCNVSVQPSGISTFVDIADVPMSATVIDTDLGEVEPSLMELSRELSVAETQTPIGVPSSVKSNISHVPSPVPVTGLSLASIDKSTCKLAVPDLFAPRISARVPSSHKISQRVPEEIASVDHDFCAHVPEGWSWGNMRNEIVQQTLFTYAVTKLENDVFCPVVQKTVTLDTDRRLQYFVYGRYVDPQDKNLEQVLHSKEALKDVLVKFKGMSVCSGTGDVGIHLVQPGTAYQDHVDKWRSKGCSLVSKKKRCEFCTKMRKSLQQRAAQLKNSPTLNRIGNISNPVDRRKLSAMRIKLRRERRQKIRAQDRVKHLTTCIKAQEARMPSIQGAAVDKTLIELNISNSEKNSGPGNHHRGKEKGLQGSTLHR